MYMMTTAYIDGFRGHPLELVLVFVTGIRTETDFVHMAASCGDGAAGNGGKTVAVTFVPASGYPGTAKDFVYMKIFFTFMVILHSV